MSMKDDQFENVDVKKLKPSHRSINTDILINATPEHVWSVLVDTDAYKEWARFLVDIQGDIKDGEKITIAFQINSKKKKLTTIEHTISVDEGKEFYWAEKGPMGICDNHHFKLEPVGKDQTRFIQSDEIMKGATWILGGVFSKMYAKGYQEFNRSLKEEVERRYGEKA